MTTPTDLAALDALFAAATPGPYYIVEDLEYPSLHSVRAGGTDGDLVASAFMLEDAQAFVAVMRAWPALRRELEIGRAAVEVIDTVEALCEAWDANGFSAKCLVKDSPAWRLYQARARLRALRETPDA